MKKFHLPSRTCGGRAAIAIPSCARAPRHPPALIWGTFPESTKYFAPSAASFMINYAVDDMDAFLARLKEKGVEPLKRTDDATGRFTWIVDPENNKIELWEPKEPKAAP